MRFISGLPASKNEFGLSDSRQHRGQQRNGKLKNGNFGRSIFGNSRRSLGVLVLAIGVLTQIGCGPKRPPTYPVKGKLVFEDGTSPRFGEIEFYNAEEKINARGRIERDGTFTVGTFAENDGAVAGTHQIVIIQQVAESPDQSSRRQNRS